MWTCWVADRCAGWRQLFEPSTNGNIDAVLRNKYGCKYLFVMECAGKYLSVCTALLTVSRQGQLLRSWDVTSGHLRYEVLTSLPPPLHPAPVPLHQTWRVGGVHATLAGKKGGVAVVASGGMVGGFVTRSGEQKWKIPLQTEDRLAVVWGEKG